jgi:hypothetical protein
MELSRNAGVSGVDLLHAFVVQMPRTSVDDPQ